MLIEEAYANLTDDDKGRLRDMVGPSPTRALTGATLERLPVQYEVQIDIAPGYRSAGIKAYGAMADDAEEITAFARRISDALYAGEDISE